MSKNAFRFIFYLILALATGVVVTLIVNNLENLAEEKRFKKAVEQDVRRAVSTYKKTALNTAPDDVAAFLNEFTRSVMKDRLIAVDHNAGKKPSREDYRLLFRFSEGGRQIDLYISTSYLEEEVSGVDLVDVIPGFVTTVIVFAFIIFYAEKRQQTIRMKEQYEIKQAELNKALKEHETLALLGRMTATLAHELKTPIATLSNLVQVLPSRINDEGFIRRSVFLAREELNRTHQLIDNLLIYGKEFSVTNDEWTELGPFLRDIAEKNNVALGSCADAAVLGDRFYLRLLFENLVRNSLQAGAGAFSLMLDGEAPSGGAAALLFEDDGAGFPGDADLGELITPFVTMRSKGAGLGLYLVQKVAAAHGGAISLYRAASGAGVRITLPSQRVRVLHAQTGA